MHYHDRSRRLEMHTGVDGGSLGARSVASALDGTNRRNGTQRRSKKQRKWDPRGRRAVGSRVHIDVPLWLRGPAAQRAVPRRAEMCGSNLCSLQRALGLLPPPARAVRAATARRLRRRLCECHPPAGRSLLATLWLSPRPRLRLPDGRRPRPPTKSARDPRHRTKGEVGGFAGRHCHWCIACLGGGRRHTRASLLFLRSGESVGLCAPVGGVDATPTLLLHTPRALLRQARSPPTVCLCHWRKDELGLGHRDGRKCTWEKDATSEPTRAEQCEVTCGMAMPPPGGRVDQVCNSPLFTASKEQSGFESRQVGRARWDWRDGWRGRARSRYVNGSARHPEQQKRKESTCTINERGGMESERQTHGLHGVLHGLLKASGGGVRCASASMHCLELYKQRQSPHPTYNTQHFANRFRSGACQLVPRQPRPPVFGAFSENPLRVCATKFSNDPRSCIADGSNVTAQSTLLLGFPRVHGIADHAIESRFHTHLGRHVPKPAPTSECQNSATGGVATSPTVSPRTGT